MAWTVLAMLIGLLIAAIVLRLWDAHLHVPFNQEGDGVLNIVAAKGLIDHGWYFNNPSVGAPLGLELYDYSALDADNLQYVVEKILTFGISDPVALVNVYYVLGFALVSAASYLVARALGFSRAVALLGSAVFTALPYHFDRGPSHLFLGEIWSVPAGGFLVLMVLAGRPLLVAAEGRTGWRRWLSWRTAGVAAAVIVVGGTTLYYAAFTLLFLFLAALLRMVATRSWRGAIPGIAALVAVGFVLVVNVSPALVYQHQHGKDTAVADRSAAESETFATSLTEMVLPIGGHRISSFARLTARHEAATPVVGEVGQHLGLLLSLGLIGLIVLLAARVLAPARALHDAEQASMAGPAASGALMAFLFATFGSFSALFAYLISPQIRAWSRMTPFVAFFVLIGVLVAAEAVRTRIVARGGAGLLGRAIAGVVLAVVGVLAVLDQTAPSNAPAYAAARVSWTNNGRFVSTIERSVPKGSMILQLPFHEFPESGAVNEMQDYDLFQGYVHSKNLRWSYGAMKGRPQDWGDEAVTRPLPWVLNAAAAAGFAGVYIDRGGYADHAVRTEATVRRTLGGAPAVVGDDAGRLVFYSTAALRARQQQDMSAAQRSTLAAALVHPLQTDFGKGFYAEETPEGDTPFRWIGQDAQLTVHNDQKTPRAAELDGEAKASPGTLTITAPGQAPKVVRFSNGGERLKVRFTAPPGDSTITFHANTTNQAQPGVDARDLRVQLFAPQVNAVADEG